MNGIMMPPRPPKKQSDGLEKPKKLKDMTDQEVIDKFNRLQREAQIRQMEKNANQGKMSKFFEDNV